VELPQTARLTFRKLTLDDLDFVAEMLADPEVMRYYPKCYSRAEAEHWIERQATRYREHGRGLWLVSERATGTPVGQVGLLIQEVNGLPESEVGYLIHRSYWRQGLATEAARATRDWAFDRLAVPRVISLIRPENIPSRGVAEKLGMRIDGRCQRATFEHLVYALDRNVTG
jgi:[ribosomal protein S5]-alanine N-acetyltransferase